MPEQGDSRRQFLIIAAIDPIDGKPCEVLISYDRMQAIGRRSMGHAMECAYIVPAVLQGPAAIFEGLTSDDDEDARGYGWRCYCGVPDQAYRVDGTAVAPFSGQVYLVFVNDEHVAYNWRWEKADPNNPRLPIGYETRFRKNLI
jgi:hypothetical protein